MRKSLRQYYSKVEIKAPRFRIGDKVRVQKQQGSFARGYDDMFSNEIFNISKINTTLPIPMYSLTSFDGAEKIMANFNENELQRISGAPLKIIKILKTERLADGLIRDYAQVQVGKENLFAWINRD